MNKMSRGGRWEGETGKERSGIQKDVKRKKRRSKIYVSHIITKNIDRIRSFQMKNYYKDI